MGMLLGRDKAVEDFQSSATEFARIENPKGVFPPVEVVPLAPKHTHLSGPLAAVLLDMDGTITQTEPLFLHGVEQVVRRVTGWETDAQWPGLLPERDYPHIIGFSTLRNLEYIFDFCQDAVVPALFFREVLAGLVFLHRHDSPQETVRWLDDVTESFGLSTWRTFAADGGVGDSEALVRDTAARFPVITQSMFAHLGLIVFHAGYIASLEKINQGRGHEVALAVYGNPDVPAVAPMPGIALLCALVKGWLPPGVAHELVVYFAEHSSEVAADFDRAEIRLSLLLRQFHEAPVPVGLVTSSGTHEASLVLNAVFRAMVDEVAQWPVGPETKAHLRERFLSYRHYFNAIVTCDDVAGGRTKPFRDPYTLALNKLDLRGDAARNSIGFEDTEAGIIAQRGAGIGLPCAVPIEHTMNHDFSAAAHTLRGGVLDAIFAHGLFSP